MVGSQAARIGIGKHHHAKFYDCNHEHTDGIGGHIVDNTLRLLEPFGIDPGEVSGYAPPFLTEAARGVRMSFWEIRRVEPIFLLA